jgi:tellurite resistance protein
MPMKPFAWLLPLAFAACAPAARVADSSGPPDRATLMRYHWSLEDARDANGAHVAALFARPRQPLQIDFTEARIAVDHACNRIGGAYTLAAGQLVVERLAQTLMACADPALAGLDAAIGDRLEGRSALTLQAAGGGTPRLVLVTVQGDRLSFIGRPTAATRFGSAGERIFFEVAPRTAACTDSTAGVGACLSVRERHYDAAGIAIGDPGQWQILREPIEGYTHEAGVRNVLRVMRYRIAKPAPGEPAHAYVLDAVVESEVVKP